LRVFGNRVLRIYGPKGKEVARGWKNLQIEDLHNLYDSPNIVSVIKSRRMRWAGHVVRLGEMKNAYNILVGKRKRKRLLGRPGRRWEDNIRMDIR
jgi:hypothetical protein